MRVAMARTRDIGRWRISATVACTRKTDWHADQNHPVSVRVSSDLDEVLGLRDRLEDGERPA